MIFSRSVGYVLIGFSVLLLITLGFIKVDFDNQAGIVCEAYHNNPNLDVDKCPVHTGRTATILTAAFVFSFAILLTGAFFSFFGTGEVSGGYGTERRTENGRGFKEVDTDKLDEEELRIYSLLRSHDGSLFQSDLVRETGLTKVRMTRVLDRLENKGVLERRRRGMANLVYLL